MAEKDDVLDRIDKQITELTRLHSISHEDHVQHHEFLAQLIREKKEKNEALSELRKDLIVGGCYAFACAAAAILWMGLQDWIKSLWNHAG